VELGGPGGDGGCLHPQHLQGPGCLLLHRPQASHLPQVLWSPGWESFVPLSSSPPSLPPLYSYSVFCVTRHTSTLLESVAMAVTNMEPVLLVVETGVGDWCGEDNQCPVPGREDRKKVEGELYEPAVRLCRPVGWFQACVSVSLAPLSQGASHLLSSATLSPPWTTASSWVTWEPASGTCAGQTPYSLC
jgi:hypothetical protein